MRPGRSRLRTDRLEPFRAVSGGLIVASNSHLDQEVAAGRFRADLYYRLNVVGFYLPPLREQPEVIPALAQKFLADFAAYNARPVRGMVPEALDALVRYRLAGQHPRVAQRDRACGGSLPDDSDPLRRSARLSVRGEPRVFLKKAVTPPPVSARVTLDAVRQDAELARLREALQHTNNNRQRAAAELGISRMTLYKKLRKYGLMTANGGNFSESIADSAE